MTEPKFRQINQLLDARPSLGPIPADLVLPWGGITLLSLLMTRSIFLLDWQWTIGFIVWGCLSWTLLTGNKPYKFLSKFLMPPQRWSRGYERHRSIAPRRKT
jgi:hypothetical protein